MPPAATTTEKPETITSSKGHIYQLQADGGYRRLPHRPAPKADARPYRVDEDGLLYRTA